MVKTYSTVILLALLATACGGKSSRSSPPPPEVDDIGGVDDDDGDEADLFFVNNAKSRVTYDEIVRNALCFDDPSMVCSNRTAQLNLPSSEGFVTITWSSSDTSVISNEGVLQSNRRVDATVQLTATFTHKNASSTKTYTIKVKADNAPLSDAAFLNLALNSLVDSWDREYLTAGDRRDAIVSDSLKAPLAKTYTFRDETVTLEWKAEPALFVGGSEMRLLQSSKEDRKVNLVVTMKRGTKDSSKIIPLTIKKIMSEDEKFVKAACEALDKPEARQAMYSQNFCAPGLCIKEFKRQTFDLSTITFPGVSIEWTAQASDYLKFTDSADEGAQVAIQKLPSFSDRDKRIEVTLKPTAKKGEATKACADWTFRLVSLDATREEAIAHAAAAFDRGRFENDRVPDISGALGEVNITLKEWTSDPTGYFDASGKLLQRPGFGEDAKTVKVILRGQFQNGPVEEIFSRERRLLPAAPTDKQAVDAVVAQLRLPLGPNDQARLDAQADNFQIFVTEDLANALPTSGDYNTQIAWTTVFMDESGKVLTDRVYIGNGRKVVTPTHCFHGPVKAVLKAVVSRGGVDSEAIPFNITIPALVLNDQQTVESLLSAMNAPSGDSPGKNVFLNTIEKSMGKVLSSLRHTETSITADFSNKCGTDLSWSIVDQNPEGSFTVTKTPEAEAGRNRYTISINGAKENELKGTLRVTVSKGGAKGDWTTPIVRKKDSTNDDIIINAMAKLNLNTIRDGNPIISASIMAYTNLKLVKSVDNVSVSWASDSPMIDANGTILERPNEPRTVILTATLSANGLSKSKSFTLNLMPPDGADYYRNQVALFSRRELLEPRMEDPANIGNQKTLFVVDRNHTMNTTALLWENLPGMDLYLLDSISDAKVTWTSSDDGVLYSDNDRLYASSTFAAPQILNLTATIEWRRAVATRKFQILVSPKETLKNGLSQQVLYLKTRGPRPADNKEHIGYVILRSSTDRVYQSIRSGFTVDPSRYPGRIDFAAFDANFTSILKPGVRFRVLKTSINTVSATSKGDISHRIEVDFRDFSGNTHSIPVTVEYTVE